MNELVAGGGIRNYAPFAAAAQMRCADSRRCGLARAPPESVRPDLPGPRILTLQPALIAIDCAVDHSCMKRGIPEGPAFEIVTVPA
jgi:hypothetical protein